MDFRYLYDMDALIKFNSAELQEKYEQSGYIVSPMLQEEQIADLSAVFDKYFDMHALSSVFHSISATDAATTKRINDEIIAICEPAMRSVLSGYKIIGAIFFVKKPGDDSELGLHIDTSFTIEPYKSVGIWIPLSDIDERNGRFCVVEKSHQFHAPYNTSGMPWVYSGVEKMLDGHLTCLSMRAGDAMIMNNNILHATQKNTSVPRVAAVLKVIDASAPLVTVYYDENAEKGKQVSLYEQDPEFCTSEHFGAVVPPETARFICHKPELPKNMTAQDVTAMLQKYYAARPA